MLAHRIASLTGPDGVGWTDVDEPAADGGVVIDVMAAGVSYADLLQTTGAYQLKVPLPFTPGMDAAGVVRAAPPDAGLAVGQRVAVLMSYGCWQEVVRAPVEWVLPLPDDMSFEAGAAAPLNYLTGLFALLRRGRAGAGETLLVHGAAGGVGTATVQLGRALGLRTVAVVGDETKREFALRSGAHHAVLSTGWLDAVRDLLGDRPVDIVVDPVGGTERFKESLRSLATEGRVVVVGFTAGEIPELRVNRLLLRNVDVIGCSFNVLATTPNGLSDAMARLSELVETGAVRPLIGSTYPLEQGSAALLEIAERRATGKVILTP